jgi:hypothetical protein
MENPEPEGLVFSGSCVSVGHERSFGFVGGAGKWLLSPMVSLGETEQ